LAGKDNPDRVVILASVMVGQFNACCHGRSLAGVPDTGSTAPTYTATALMPNTDTDTDTSDTPTPYTVIVHEHDIVSLEMDADFIETAVTHRPRPTLHRIIRDCCGLESSDLTTCQSSSYTSSYTSPHLLRLVHCATQNLGVREFRRSLAPGQGTCTFHSQCRCLPKIV
jgi:hypothetical protein